MLIKNNLQIKKFDFKLIRKKYNTFSRYIEKYKHFSPSVFDGSCSQHWKTIEKSTSNNEFTILLPPPNVTGNLHLGHALSFSLQDTIMRSKRMMDYKTEWIPGFDHAGIATQVQVEKLLQKKFGKSWSSNSISRPEFVRICNKWSKIRRDNISCQIKSLSLNPDWHSEYFTLNQSHSQVVRHAFIKLFHGNKIYRDNRVINWSCHLQSAISDIEVESKEIDGETKITIPGYQNPIKFGIIHQIAYNFDDNADEELIIATTRPETIPGDVCIAVHPSDSRYTGYIGRNVRNPVTGHIMPVIADEEVDKEFGTGVIKVTPAHSPVDYKICKKHNFKILNIIDHHGKMENIDCLNLSGVPRFTARDIIVNHLIDRNLYRGSKNTHKMQLPICSRSGDVVEYLIRPQWFFDISDACDKAIQKIQEGSIKIQPRGYVGEFIKFLETKEPWCISRQLKWGHSIPAFSMLEDNKHKYFVGNTQEEIVEHFPFLDPNILSQDPDVLDTWFSSALIPLSVGGWPGPMNELFPSSILVTGYDIVPLWVCRMMIMSLELVNRLPFDKVLLHGMICDSSGQKMSKSKGNVIDPMQLIGKHLFDKLMSECASDDSEVIDDLQLRKVNISVSNIGSDAVRFSLLEHIISGHHIKYDLNKAVLGRNLMQKMWQTLQFVYHNWSDSEISTKRCYDLENNWNRFRIERLDQLNMVQKYLLYHLSKLISTAQIAQKEYIYHPLCIGVREFWWNYLCSVFVEWSKSETCPLQKEINLELTLLAMNTCIHLIHPVIPQMTEILWHNIYKDDVTTKSIGNEKYPSDHLIEGFIDEDFKSSATHIADCLEKVSEINYWIKTLKLSRTKLKQADLMGIFVVNNEFQKSHEVINRLSGVPLKTNNTNGEYFYLEIDNCMKLGISKNLCGYEFLESCLNSKLNYCISQLNLLKSKLNENPSKQDLSENLVDLESSMKNYEKKLASFQGVNN